MQKFSLDKKTLSSLYLSGKSMADIAKASHCSIHKVVYWMNKYEIMRRSRSEAIYTKQNPFGDPFSIKQNLDAYEIFLYGLGLGIYWGEGEKVSKYSVRVANTDPFIIKMFTKFLLTICKLDKHKIRYSLICFNDSNPENVSSYWENHLKTDKAKFGKIVVIPKQGKGIYKKKSQFGVCTITVSNIKLKAWILNEIAKLKINADIV